MLFKQNNIAYISEYNVIFIDTDHFKFDGHHSCISDGIENRLVTQD